MIYFKEIGQILAFIATKSDIIVFFFYRRIFQVPNNAIFLLSGNMLPHKLSGNHKNTITNKFHTFSN